MKLLEYSASESVKLIREWNSEFRCIVEAIKEVEEFLTEPDSHKGDDNYLSGVFNSIEILKSSVGLNSAQKELCSKVTDMVQALASEPF